MKFLLVFWRYLLWHYSKGVKASFLLWENLTSFLYNFFSIRSLLGNFFTPWRRLSDIYPKWYEFKEFFSTFLTNGLMRIVGMFIRFFVLLFGFTVILIFILLYPVAFIVWLLLPPAIIFMILAGIVLIINGIWI
ncbi:MAG: hypothetical protein WC631_01085 [Candidatus Paceibacterota bacterium]